MPEATSPFRSAEELARFGVVLAALVMLHASALTLPHHWDALNRVHNAHTIAAHGFSPFLPEGMTFLDAQGRPPLLLMLLALTVLLQPYDLVAAHLLWLGFAALAVSMTYRLGSHAWSPMVGAVAALWLAANPLFFAQSEIIVLEAPLTALTVTAAVCLFERRRGLYLLTATLLVLAKEAAQFALPGFVLFAWWAAPPGKRWRESAIAALPFLALVAWMAACKSHYGWFLHPFGLGFVRLEEGGSVGRGLLLSLAYLATRSLQIGFWDGNWAMTILVLSSLAATSSSNTSRRRLALAGGLALIVYFAYPAIIAVLSGTLLPGAGIAVADRSTQDALAQVEHLRAVIAVVAGLVLLALPGLRRIDLRDPRLWLAGGVIGSYLGFFTFIKFRMVRYLLPTYPFVFLIAAAALRRSTDGSVRRVVVAVAVVVLFVSHYWGTRSGPGNVLETNLEFRDMIAVRRSAAEYLQTIAPGRVLASWPETMELRFPYEGYVSRPLTAIEDPRLGADVLYTSPQSSDPDLATTLRRALPGVSLQPLLRVSRRGKSVELFRIIPPP